MSKRTDLISRITTNLSGHSRFSVSAELPFESGGNPLYLNNKNTVYVDEQQITVNELYNTLDNQVINENITVINAYFATDAKEQLSDIDTVVANLLLAGNVISNTLDVSKSYETSITDDTITYSFEYTFTTI